MVTHGQIIDPWWTLSDIESLNYINEPFNDPVSLAHWRELGYTQSRFTGDLYDMRNPQPHWIDGFKDYFPYQFFSWSLYRMSPGTTLPNHSDTYKRFREIHGIHNVDQIVRTIVFLEDWHSGHYFEIDGSPVVNWYAGQTVTWTGTTPHLAANVGMTPRYTLQLTGAIDEIA